MAYVTTTALKLYLGITTSGDDSLLSILITAAQSVVEGPYPGTDRKWEVRTETQYYDYQGPTRLDLRDDLISIGTFNNGDDETLTEGTDFYLYPLSGPPYRWLEIKTDGGENFQYSGTKQRALNIVGSWGYTTTAPQRIVQATKRLAAYYYHQKDAGVYDVTATPELGIITVPQGIPADVMKLLHANRKKFMLG